MRGLIEHHTHLGFQHTAARRRLASTLLLFPRCQWFQHTAARRRLDRQFAIAAKNGSFNTQPPEGGWVAAWTRELASFSFNTQPPEGGWGLPFNPYKTQTAVSTHSRPKAAGRGKSSPCMRKRQFQHTAARRRLGQAVTQSVHRLAVSTHSRPKAAGQSGVKPYQ